MTDKNAQPTKTIQQKFIEWFVDIENWFNTGFQKTEKPRSFVLAVGVLLGIGQFDLIKNNYALLIGLVIVYAVVCLIGGWALDRLYYYHVYNEWNNKRNYWYSRQLALLESIDKRLANLEAKK